MRCAREFGSKWLHHLDPCIHACHIPSYASVLLNAHGCMYISCYDSTHRAFTKSLCTRKNTHTHTHTHTLQGDQTLYVTPSTTQATNTLTYNETDQRSKESGGYRSRKGGHVDQRYTRQTITRQRRTHIQQHARTHAWAFDTARAISTQASKTHFVVAIVFVAPASFAHCTSRIIPTPVPLPIVPSKQSPRHASHNFHIVFSNVTYSAQPRAKRKSSMSIVALLGMR